MDVADRKNDRLTRSTARRFPSEDYGASNAVAEELNRLAEAAVHKFLAEQVNKRVLESFLDHGYTEPVREFARRRGISPTKVYKWIEEGLLLSFLDGNRRHVVVSSYDRLVRKRIAEQPGGKPKLPEQQSEAQGTPGHRARKRRVAAGAAVSVGSKKRRRTDPSICREHESKERRPSQAAAPGSSRYANNSTS